MAVRIHDVSEALDGLLTDGMIIAAGGFGLCGIPADLIDGVHRSGVKDLTVVANNMGIDGKGLGLLLESGQVRKVIASYAGENRAFADLHLRGRVEVEFTPQGTLAERLRAGGAGIPAFFTRTGVGTIVADGKPLEVFDGVTYLRESAIIADLALVHAHTGDEHGNLRYRLTARNFNPLVAAAGRVTVAEVEHLVEALDPDDVVTPSIHVDRFARCTEGRKEIEKLTVRASTGAVR
ncbi:CoA transferase subunit A [Nocardioides humi]|uniref:CoA transferase subunit A n=1 Tax=Nocardioides humi TaxID=449461 RepID=A0ABN2C017_9ACTN|nr:CoA transferase subunit A [Nocardioides humi]